jgi:rhomboid protease GluP
MPDSRRLWFKLQRLKNDLQRMFGTKEEKYSNALRMCPACRGLIDRKASTCPLCGTRVGGARSRPSSVPGRVMGGVIPVPSTANSAVIIFIIILYAISWALTQRAASASLHSAPALGGISPTVLVELGAKGPWILAGQYWRLVTAVFLHAGLIHIGFNLWCLFDIGPMVESLFCGSKYIVIFLVTGVFGYVLSLIWSPFGMSIGASGAIMGLIGVMITASYRLGSMGRELRRQLWKWVIYIAIFGLIPIFSVDNAAHLGGFISGLALGYLIPDGEPRTRGSENLWNTLAVVSVAITAGSFALMALQLGHLPV